jgi:hypothetical protein
MMRTKGPAFVILCLLALIWAMPAAAQEQTGSIQGTVKDSSGAVLPGVTVEARSPSVVGVSTAVTDAQGVYRFPALPPGTYTVSATLQGFNAQKITGTISLGQSLKVDITMTVGGVAETVQVTGEAPLIDTKQNASFTTVSKDIIDRIPKGRDFSTVVSTAAGAQDESRSGGIQVDGSSGSENRFIIDGMDTTNLRTGVQGKTMMLDFIQEVQVKSSGYNAEFGGSTGGVISALTKSGSNQIRGMAGLYENSNFGRGVPRGYHRYSPYTIPSQGVTANYTPEGGTCAAQGMMGNVPTCLGPSGGLLAPDNPFRVLSPVADIGGPVFKDKLWYYAGWSYSRQNNSRDATFYSDPNQVKRHFDWWSYNNYLNYNATTQLSNNVRVKFSGSNQKNKNRGNAPVLQPDNDPTGFPGNAYVPAGTNMKGYTTATFPLVNGQLDQATFDRTYVLNGADSWNNAYSGNVDWVVSPTFFINATAGYFMYNNTTPAEMRGNSIRHVYAGTPTGLPGVPANLMYASGWSDTITSGGTARDIFNRAFVNVNGTLFKSMAGQHTIKAGLRFERFGNDVETGNVYPTVTLNWNADYSGTRGTYGYYELTKSATVGNIHSNNYSIWLQDSWSVNNKLTVNAGVRAENEYVPSYKQGVANCNDAPNDPNCAIDIKFGMRDKIAPRLGFAYDIKGDSKWKAYGSYSWYYDITKLELPRGSFGGDHWISYYWTLDTYDFSTINCVEGNTGCPGTFISSIDWRHSSNQIDDIFSAYFDRPNMTGIDPNLKPVKTGDMQLGIDHELNPTMSLGVRYIHKWASRTIEDVGIYAPDLVSDPTGATLVEDYLISNPGEGFAVNMEPRYPNLITPKPKRNYDAFEIHLRKRLAHNWAADATYTYSRLYGNYPGLASSDEWGRNSPNVNRLWDNTVMSYNPQEQLVYGLLNSDRPHQFKLSGSYDFNFGTSVGAFWIMETGLSNSTIFRASSGGYPVFPNGRSDLGRLPMYYNLDMVVTHELKVGGHRRLQLQANIDNVLDLKRITGWYYEQYGNILWRYTGHMNVALPITYFYTPYDLKAAATQYTTPKAQGGTGGSLWDNGFFGVPDTYSGRRAIRFSVKFSF